MAENHRIPEDAFGIKGQAFWEEMSHLATTHPIVIDRPKGKPHPRWQPDVPYPFDYGYLEGTSAADGHGIDVWVGSLGSRTLAGILCTYDTFKRDAEIKLLLGCAPEDVETIIAFHDENMRVLYITNPLESK